MLHLFNLIIPFLVLLPSFLMIGLPPNNKPENIKETGNRIYIITEGIGRIGVLVTPVFSAIRNESLYEVLALIGMVIFLLLYYIGWLRYFRSNRDFKLLFIPLYGIPVPLAIMPVLYFLSASIILHSYLLFLSSMVLAVGHIPNSLYIYRQES